METTYHPYTSRDNGEKYNNESLLERGAAMSKVVVFPILLIFLMVFIPLYFLPTIIAIKKKHLEKNMIIIINVLLGGTGAGWVISLIWALSDSSMSKLNRLEKLREKGLITEEEYAKSRLEIID